MQLYHAFLTAYFLERMHMVNYPKASNDIVQFKPPRSALFPPLHIEALTELRREYLDVISRQFLDLRPTARIDPWFDWEVEAQEIGPLWCKEHVFVQL